MASRTASKTTANHDKTTAATNRYAKSNSSTESATWKLTEQLVTPLYHLSTNSVLDHLEEVYMMLKSGLIRICGVHQGKINPAISTKLRLIGHSVISRILTRGPELISKVATQKRHAAFLLFLTLIGSASALDNEIALQPYQTIIGTPDPGNRIQLGLICTYIVMIAGVLTTATTNLLGPLMGVSSVLWFIMRNDAAIQPSIAWA